MKQLMRFLALLIVVSGVAFGQCGSAGHLILNPVSGQYDCTANTGVPPSGAAGGDLSGTYPNPTVAKIEGVAVKSGLSCAADGYVLTWVAANSQFECIVATTANARCTFTAASTCSITGLTGVANKAVVSCYDNSSTLVEIIPNDFAGTTADTLVINFSAAQTGYCNASTGVGATGATGAAGAAGAAGQIQSINSDTTAAQLIAGTSPVSVATAGGTTTVSLGTVPFGSGGTGLTSASDDTVMVSSGSAWVAKAMPDCTDTGGNHVNYTAATNAFSCGTSDSGANRALSNLASVSINTALLAQTGVDLGATATPFRDLYLFGSGTYATTYLKLTGTPTSTRTITFPDTTGTVAVPAGTLAITTGKTFTALKTLTLDGTDSTTMTFPATSATIARTDAANTFTGTQTIGALVATTVNGNTFTTGTGVLTIAASKTLTVSNTLTLAGTDSTTMTFPTTSATIARTDAAQSFTGVQTFVAPILGTPTSATLTNATGLPAAGVVGTAAILGANTFTGAQTNSTAGALSAPAFTLTGAPVTGGSATTTKPLALIETAAATSANWSTNGTMLGINAPSGFTGNVIDLQLNGGTSLFKVQSNGNISLTGTLDTAGTGLAGNLIFPHTSTSTLTLNNTAYSTASKFSVTMATGTMSQTSGTNGAVTITPTYNQSSGTAANTDLLINRTETAVGSGAQLLLDAQVGGSSKFKVDDTGLATSVGLTTSGVFTSSVNGALSAPGLTATGTWVTGGSATTTKPYFLIETTGATSTGWSTAGTGIGVNAASGFTGRVADFQINGTTRFSVDSSGSNMAGTLNVNTVVNNNANTTFTLNNNGYSTASRFAVTMATGTHSQTSGTNGAVTIIPTYNQASGSAANTDLLINRTQTAVGSGAQRLLAAQVGGVTQFDVTNTGTVPTYGALATANNGLPAQLGTPQSITNRSTSLGTTALYTTVASGYGGAGQYAVNGSICAHTAGTAGSTVLATVSWTDAVGARSFATATIDLGGTTACQAFNIPLQSAASNAINIASTINVIGGTPTYDLYAQVVAY